VVQKGACLDCGLDFFRSCLISFYSMLSGFAVEWLVSNDWDCLMSLWKNHAFLLLFGSIILVFSLMLYLGWLGDAHTC
jgi:hypothetical protein